MKHLLVFTSMFAIALADGQGGYSGGAGSSQQFSTGGAFNFGNGGYTTTSDNSNNNGINGANSFAPTQGGEASQQGQVFRYVSVHTAPEDPEDQAARVIKVPGEKNRHVNLIFVKAPSNGADQKTEIVLPEQDEQKNLVYVLVQKSDPASSLKIKRPQPTKPSKPEVYFIRYKNAQQQQAGETSGTGGFNNGGGTVGSAGFTSSGSVSAGSAPAILGNPSPAYGAPFYLHIAERGY